MDGSVILSLSFGGVPLCTHKKPVAPLHAPPGCAAIVCVGASVPQSPKPLLILVPSRTLCLREGHRLSDTLVSARPLARCRDSCLLPSLLPRPLRASRTLSSVWASLLPRWPDAHVPPSDLGAWGGRCLFSPPACPGARLGPGSRWAL